jgi:hypothetical protein
LEILSPPRRINCAAIYTGRGSNVTLAMKCCKHLPLIRPRCYSALTIRFILRICQYMRSGILQSRAAHSVTLLFVFDYSSSAFVNICAVKPCNHVPVIQSRCYSALIIRPQRLSIYAHHTPLAICFVRPRQSHLSWHSVSLKLRI